MNRLFFLSLLSASSCATALDFNRDVRPVLAQQCFSCHGMDDHGRRGKLRLDLPNAAYGSGKSGEVAIKPYQPDSSEVVKRIFSSNEDELMPPPHAKKVMSEREKAVIRQWIAEGAQYEAHWAYQPLRASVNPKASIDFFIRQKLTEEKLEPAPEADAYALVRRLYLDLIGLPPTPEQADAFAEKCAQQAGSVDSVYEALVDDLLKAPQYGERWARRWLDLARYADTNGFEKDRPRPIWPYRDWVVKALNEDMPFDQFSIKQLAGDMLPNATTEDRIATGFHRNTMLNEEGGIDPNEYRFYAMVDRVGVTGTTWMGLTMNCAQCHTHKYDPILHTDYYSLMALLNNADEPTYAIPTPEIEAEQKAHVTKLAQIEAALPSKFPGGQSALEARLSEWVTQTSKQCAEWQVLRPKSMKTTLPHLELQSDGFILGSGDISKSDVYHLHLQAPIQGVTAIKLEVASHPSLPNDGPGLTYYEGPIGGFFLSEVQAFQNNQRVKISSAEATNDTEEDKISDATPVNQKPAKAKKTNRASAALDGEMSSGWQVLGGYGQEHMAVFRFETPVDLTQGLDLKMLFEKHFACSLGHFRLSVTTHATPVATGLPFAVENALAKGDLSQHAAIQRSFLLAAPEMKAAVAPLRVARRQMPRGQPTLVMQERLASPSRQTHLHHRGEYLQPKQVVSPAVPAFLPGLRPGEPANRLSLAKWFFRPENPLTARVTVNRQWQAFFGRGLVKSLEDFGYQSEAPSHPELLDWLAVQFVKDGWSLKRLHKRIVMSATYKQASRRSKQAEAKDPENVLLSHAPRFRLDAEIIRDSALQSAGVLSLKQGGPGVYPPQPASVTTEGTYGKVEWKTSQGEDRYRRSLYTFTKRTAPFAMSMTFDAPTGEACLARRDVSNSPLQALTLLNDQMFMEAAQAMARKVMAETEQDQDRLRLAFRRCLTRPPSEEELALLSGFVAKQRAQSLQGEALWTAVCRALLNLDETITHP